MDYRSEPPHIPRKPTAYTNGGQTTSMHDLLSSLNIDEDYSRSGLTQNISLEQSQMRYGSYREDLQAIYPARSEPDLGARSSSNIARTPAARQSISYIPSYADTHESSDRAHPMRTSVSENHLDSSQSTGPKLVSSPGQTGSFSGKRPLRKPVPTEESLDGKYFSPDDLDSLISDRTQIHEQFRPRSYTADTMQPIQHTRSESTLSRSQHVRQQSDRLSPDTRSHFGDYKQDSFTACIGPRNTEIDSTADRRSQSISSLASRNLPYPQNYGNIRMPSPPNRHNSVPLPDSRVSSPAAFQPRSEFHPISGAYLNSLPEPQFGPPSRQNSAPIRSMSALSNHSHRSPDRQYRHPIRELESQYGGRIPSPDTNQRFPDIFSEDDRSGAASIAPSTQARRGRQKGEVIVESDLPAMPLLFDNEEGHKILPRVPQTLGRNRTPSPMKSPGSPHPGSPNKRSPTVREYDALQSVKVLPIKPIKCPPWSLEERYHASTFVKTNKFKIKLYPSTSPFVAGGEISGHFDILSDEGFRAQLGSTQVLVGDIGVEVIGYEEIQHVDSGHNPRSVVFLYGRRVFQHLADKHPIRAAEEHILTSAVVNDPPPDEDGYRVASKGITSFPFAFPLPVDCPSSADVTVARINYVVTAYATVKLQGSQETIATCQSVQVVEAWDVGNPVYRDPVEATQGRDIENYHEIAAVGKIEKTLYLEGHTIVGDMRVINHSLKKIKEVKYLLVNKVTFFGDKRQSSRDLNPPDDFSIEQTVTGHTEPHVILKGGEQIWNFSIQIPMDRCISVRNSALFEVTPFVLIKFSTGPLVKSTKLRFPPICVASAHSMVDGFEKRAPTSSSMQWANLPSLYKYQRVIDRQPREAENGLLELTDLMLYRDAHERVMLLNV